MFNQHKLHSARSGYGDAQGTTNIFSKYFSVFLFFSKYFLVLKLYYLMGPIVKFRGIETLLRILLYSILRLLFFKFKLCVVIRCIATINQSNKLFTLQSRQIIFDNIGFSQIFHFKVLLLNKHLST